MSTPDHSFPPGFIPLTDRPSGIDASPALEGEGLAGDRGRGSLRIYLGAAPGVGKTYAMLREAHRLRTEGRDVAIGFVETHGRADTAAQIADLEVIPNQTIDYHGVRIEEMDADAVLARAPEIVVVDELAHTNAPGSPHAKRWEDVEVIRQAGIHVLSALNVQHIASLQDLIADITGITVRETVPDSVIAGATEIQLVDLPVEMLLDRIDLGKVYPPEQAKRARERFFQPGTLTALRELALRRTAEGVDERLTGMMLGLPVAAPGQSPSASPAERIIVILEDTPSWGEVLRTGWRTASVYHGELIVLDLHPVDDRTTDPASRRRNRDLAHDLGARIEDVNVTNSFEEALVNTLASLRATTLVIGIDPEETYPRRWFGLSKSSDFERILAVLRNLPTLTVQLMSIERAS